MSPSTLGIGGGTGLSPGGSNSGSGYSQTRVFVGGIGYTRILSKSLFFDGNFGVGHNGLTWYEADFARNLGPTLGIPGTNSDGDGSYGPDPNRLDSHPSLSPKRRLCLPRAQLRFAT